MARLREIRRRREWRALRRHRERMRHAPRSRMRVVPAHPHAEPYHVATRSWGASLLFVGPLLLIYEVGVILTRTPAGTEWRTGADAWVRGWFESSWRGTGWLPPIVLIGILVAGFVVADRRRPERRLRPSLLPGMTLESLVLGAGLIGLNRLCSQGFDLLQGGGSIPLRVGSPEAGSVAWLAFLGAGLYEEGLFRLALLPALERLLRGLRAPSLLAATCAVTGSSLVFSLAHHAGPSAEPFEWYPFFFRWLAGIYFAWICSARGFGIAVGAHAAYDVGVGGLDAIL
jgi:hypothetical protein